MKASKNVDAIYPLSPLQLGMIYHSRMAPNSGVYVVQTGFEITGEISLEVFKSSWSQVIERHGIFRTMFMRLDTAKPQQVVMKKVSLPWQFYDWSSLDSTIQQQKFDDLLRKERKLGFDFAKPPLMRFILVRLASQKYRFLWSYHHVLADGWSMPLVLNDWQAYYLAGCRGEELVLPGVRPYRDYIRWLGTQDSEQLAQYWRQYLQGVSEPTQLGVEGDYQVSEDIKAMPQICRLKLSQTQTQHLQELVKAHKLTLNIVAQAAWGYLLSRYSNQQDVIFGATVSGRPAQLSGVESMIGPFINTIPVRISVHPNASVIDWLTAIHQAQLQRSEFEHAPLVDVQQYSDIAPGQQLFDTLFVFENFPVSNATREDGRPSEQRFAIKLLQSVEQTSFGLTLMVVPGEQLSMSITYDPARFTLDCIERMLGHYQCILSSLATASSVTTEAGPRLGQLQWLQSAELDLWLNDFNQTTSQYDRTQCIFQLIEQQALANPDACALVFEQHSMSYQQLNERANQLAHHLINVGVKADMMVGVCLERSFELVVSLLAIAKAGGAYVPLDSEYPAKRLAYMIADANPVLVISAKGLSEVIGPVMSKPECLLYIDEQAPLIDAAPITNPQVTVSVEQAMYMIYTSGSTGKPKGVVNQHGGVLNRLVWMQKQYPIDSQDRVLQKTPFSFDVSVWEFFWPLLSGATLVIAKPGGHRDANYMAQLIEQCQVTTLHFVPSMLQVFLQTEQTAQLTSVRQVMCSGEALSGQLRERFYQGFSHSQLHNLYGPTEAAIDVSHWTCSPEQQGPSVPIGKPIDNTQLYILDNDLHCVPVGVIGQLYIGGDNLARGYHNRFDLTAESFIANPFSTQPGSRLYKTGDLCRVDTHGVIEYIGRVDFQVKLRGFRIELAEIEYLLAAHPLVDDCAVIVRQDQPGSQRLVGYVVLTANAAIEQAQLLAHIEPDLPNHMLPSVLVFMDQLPLTANGKLDRKALPSPQQNDHNQGTFVAPTSDNERILASLWTQLLGLDTVSINDNFFALGGDSIISIQLVAKAKAVGLQFSAKTLFDNPTISSLALACGKVSKIEAEQGQVTGDSPLLPIAHWYFAQDKVDINHFNQSMMLQSKGEVQADLLRQVVAALLEHHDVLRSRFDNHTKAVKQCFDAMDQSLVDDAWAMADLTHLSYPQQIEQLQILGSQYQGSLNITEGPLLRVVWFKLSDTDHRILLVLHHLVVDGVSWGILLEDFNQAYSQLLSAQTVQLINKTSSYKTWAGRLRKRANSDEMLKPLQYWSNYLRQPKNVLPVDEQNDGKMPIAAQSQLYQLALSTEQTSALLHQAPLAYHTQINDLLLSALSVAIYRQWGEKQLHVNLEGHGREDLFDDIDLSRTIGWFTTLFPLALKIDNPEDLGSCVIQIKEQLRALPNKGLDFGLLKYLRKAADATEFKNLAEPKVSFNYLGQFDRTFSQGADEADAQGPLFSAASESGGTTVGEQRLRSHLLDFNGVVSGGSLQLSCRYSPTVHQPSTVQSLMAKLKTALVEIIDHCTADDFGGLTPSDVPESQLDQSGLKQLFAHLESKFSLKARDITQLYPLSPLQIGMLHHTRLAPNSGVYVIQSAFAISGPLDVEAFAGAWQHVIDRHSVYRTMFYGLDSEAPLQIVLKYAQLPFEQLDWCHLDEQTQAQQFESLLSQERLRDFSLDKAPLMRVVLVKLAAQHYRFIWSQHHALSDGWSLPLIIADMGVFYHQQCGENIPKLSPAQPYRDYIRWLSVQDQQQARQYWSDYLSNFSAPTPLGIDGEYPQDDSQNGLPSSHSISLDETLTRQLNELARSCQLTLNIIAQGMWALLLGHYSSHDDVVFGTVVSGRPDSLDGVEHMVGPFINTVPVRVDVCANQELIPWLQQLHQSQNQRNAFEYTALSQIQQCSDLAPGLSLFESLMVFENYPMSEATEGAQQQVDDGRQPLRFSFLKSVEQTNYPLTIGVIPGPSLVLQLNFDSTRIESSAAKRLLQHYHCLFSNLVANPNGRLEQLAWYSEAERQQLLIEFNQTELAYEADLWMHQLIAKQAALRPDSIAVVFDQLQISYGYLDCQANKVANYLRQRGVGPEVAVGVCMARCAEVVIALLGVWKAGGVYVPLDPNYPAERLEYMASDSAITRVLINGQTPQGLEQLTQIEKIDMQGSWLDDPQLSDICPDAQQVGLCADHLAYIIYTSGSTGLPKGVQIPHRGLVNVAAMQLKDFELDSDERVLQFVSFSFDASLWGVYMALVPGCALVLTPDNARLPGDELISLLENQHITAATIPPSVLSVLPEQRFVRIHTLVSTAEACPVAINQRWAPNRRFYNGYGPTETTIGATIGLCDPNEPAEPSIGRPFSNTKLYLLDRQLQPVAQGIPGQVYVSGVGLARGYMNRPDLTASVFIPDPFSSEPGARMYDTADMARYRPNGWLDYVGRLDSQVQIQGLRVELGEVESRLRDCDGVREAVITVAENDSGHKRLVAYMVAEDSVDIDIKATRAQMQSKLPDHMVPSAFITLEMMPLTINGKIDRRALPAPDLSERISRHYVAPRTRTEAAVADIWAQVLELPQVGVTDNFFEVGGHSLLAGQINAKITQVLGLDLPLKTLFEAPTIEAFSRQIDSLSEAGGFATVVLDKAPAKADLPLSFAQHRLWFLEQLGDNSADHTISAAYRLKGQLDVAILRQSFEQLIERHQVLRSHFGLKDESPVVVINDTMNVNIELSDLSQMTQKQIDEQLTDFAQQPFDLAQGPLIKVCIFRLNEQEHVVAINIHHIISDGWSMGVLVAELSVFYTSAIEQSEVDLAPLTIQYSDYAYWQRQWFEGDNLKLQLEFWQQQLANLPPLLELPTDYPRPAVQSHQGASCFFGLPKALLDKLQVLSSTEGATLFMTLLAAFDVMLSRYSGQTDIAVGTPVANRARPELEPLIGLFLNTLVLRTTVNENECFSQLLQRVKTTCLDCYSHQDVPFEQVVDVLKPQRSLSHSPLFQVMLVLQNASNEQLSLPGLTLEPTMASTDTAKFDLTLSLQESENGLYGSIEYCSSLFSEKTIEQMIEHFRLLLEAVVAHPHQSLHCLSMLSGTEQQQLLHQFNHHESHEPPSLAIHQQFEQHVRQTPDACALAIGEHQLSYDCVNRRANQLARRLVELQVTAEVRVGLCMERGIELYICLLAIWKAGGAYVPLEPNYPQQRLDYVIEDSQLAILLTDDANRSRFEHTKVNTIVIEPQWADFDGVDDGQVDVPINLDNLAYMIYTSGTTGQPKGTLLVHRGLANLACAQSRRFEVCRDSRVLQFSSISFDASISEIVMSWVSGSTLVCATRPEIMPGEPLAQLLQKQAITHITLPPGALALMPPVTLPQLSHLITAGESCAQSLVKQFAAGRRMYNAYGPTETTVCATMGLADEQLSHCIGPVTDNMRVYVLDEHLSMVPFGAVGELYVAGIGLARGYHQRGDLSAEAFIPDPFSAVAGQRLYRTGDLARYMRDGRLLFVGRADHQVKVRGFRIEPAEIEVAIMEADGISEALVQLYQGSSGDQRLVAYVVNEKLNNSEDEREQSQASAQLRAHLESRLPSHMVPANLVLLSHLPLTVNGKVDRDKLPKPGVSLTQRASYTAPSNELELQIAQLWSQLLDVEQIGIEDNFFEIGGDSFLIVKLHQRLGALIKQPLQLVDLFKYPTIASLVQFLNQDQAEKQQANAEKASQQAARMSKQKQSLASAKARSKQRRRKPNG